MKSNEQPLTEEQQKKLDRIEKLTMKDEKELLARIIIEEEDSNISLERNRKNTSTLTTMAWVLIALYILSALIPTDTTILEILN